MSQEVSTESSPLVLSALGIIVGLIALTLWAYTPGLDGPFLLDDFANLEPLNNHGGVTDWASFQAFVFGNGSGPLGRPLAMASFLVNDSAWPGDPASYKYTNLLLHLICGLLAFGVVRRLLATFQPPARALGVASLVSLFWLLTPINVSTTLYVVQRMAQLSTLFMLGSLAAYLAFRAAHDKRRDGIAFGWGCAAALAAGAAVLCKENGALVVPVIAAMELTVFRADGRHRPLPVLYRLALFGPALAVLVYPLLDPTRIELGYQLRQFTLTERVLTEARILWDYAYNALVPNLSGNGLFHDDYPVSRGLFQPWSTAVAVAGHLLVLAGAWRVRTRLPLVTLGILWWYLGHSLESTYLPLELYFEHRNYFPLIGLLLAVAALGLAIRGSVAIRWSAAAGAVVLAVMAGGLTSQAARTWGSEDLLAIIWAVENPTSVRAQRALAAYQHGHGNTERALRVLRDAWRLEPADPSIGVRILTLECLAGKAEDRNTDGIIASARQGGAPRDGVVSAADGLIMAVTSGACDLTYPEVHRILSALEVVSAPPLGAAALAKLKYRHAEVFLAHGRLDRASRLLEEVFELQPTVSVALRQAVVLARAGRVGPALERLEVAEALNHDRGWGLPDRSAELGRLRAVLEKAQARVLAGQGAFDAARVTLAEIERRDILGRYSGQVSDWRSVLDRMEQRSLAGVGKAGALTAQD